MVEIAYIQGILCPKHVRVDEVVRIDALPNDGHECFCSCIGYYGCINLSIALQKSGNRYLPDSSPATLANSHSAKVAFIGLNSPSKR